MGTVDLNMDFDKPVIIEAGKLDWTASPQAGVERKRLERENAESGRATSIVRYLPGVSFPEHVHGGGEEYLVLGGTFSDADGDFDAGFYVRNPPGSSHSPFSNDGCTIFVKLSQMQPAGEPQVRIDSRELRWQSGALAGHELKLLHRSQHEVVTLERLAPGTTLGERQAVNGEEILVLDGALEIDGHTYGPRTWSRTPAGSASLLSSRTGCEYWVKRHHLKIDEQ